MQTSKLLVISALVLSGCVGAVLSSNPKAVEVNVTGQILTIAAPDGFCIERRSTEVNTIGAFTVLGPCVGADSAAEPTPLGAILTASVSKGSLVQDGRDMDDAFNDLGTFFRTESGRVAISKSRDLEKVRIRRSFVEDETLYVLIQDGGARLVGESLLFWRGFLEINQRLVTISINGFGGKFPGESVTLRELKRFAEVLREANPAKAAATIGAPITTNEPVSETDVTPEPRSVAEASGEAEAERATKTVYRLPPWWPIPPSQPTN